MSATAARAADRGEVALVAIAEGLASRASAAAHVRPARRSGPAASRPGRRRVARTGSPSGRRTRTMSPSANTSGWPGSVRSGSTVTRPARSRSAPGELGQPSGEGGRRDAGGPDHGAARDPLVRRLACRSSRRSITPVTGRPVSSGHAEPFASERAAFAESDGGKRRQHSIRRLDEQDASRPRDRSRGSRGAGCRGRARAI